MESVQRRAVDDGGASHSLSRPDPNSSDAWCRCGPRASSGPGEPASQLDQLAEGVAEGRGEGGAVGRVHLSHVDVTCLRGDLFDRFHEPARGLGVHRARVAWNGGATGGVEGGCQQIRGRFSVDTDQNQAVAVAVLRDRDALESTAAGGRVAVRGSTR